MMCPLPVLGTGVRERFSTVFLLFTSPWVRRLRRRLQQGAAYLHAMQCAMLRADTMCVEVASGWPSLRADSRALGPPF